jgi:hypothetical protein
MDSIQKRLNKLIFSLLILDHQFSTLNPRPSITPRLSTSILGISLGQRSHMDNYSNQTKPHLLSYPSSPQSWWPSPGLVYSPSPALSPPQAWLSDNMAPPSPAYCDGCQRWGNLLSVTVSQTRPH